MGLVKYFLSNPDPPTILIAACRNPDKATELQELKKKNNRLQLLQLGEFKKFKLKFGFGLILYIYIFRCDENRFVS